MKGKTWYVEQLLSNVCQCGKRKKPHMSFCPNCFFRLPEEKRDDLYKQWLHGYEESYDAAVEYLNK